MDESVIVTRDLTRRFGSFTAVRAVSFEVRRGEIFGYLGANGAGKTTTIRMLCGLLAPSAGEARVAGFDVGRQAHDVKRSIGYMSQRFSLYVDLTVEENLRFFAGAYGLRGARREGRVAFALDHAGLRDRRRSLTGALPGGIRQRLALASALLQEPQIVFLDEPTAGVDPASRRDFWRIIRALARQGTTVFVTTHHLDEAEYCGRVGLMVDGRLVALDTPQGLKRTHAPGTVWAIAGASADALRRALHGVPGVLDVQPFGNRVHVRVADAPDRGGEAGGGHRGDDGAFFAALGSLPDVSYTRTEATLEDVFLALVNAHGGGGGRADDAASAAPSPGPAPKTSPGRTP